MEDIIVLSDKDLENILNRVVNDRVDIYSIVPTKKYSLPNKFYLKFEDSIIHYIYTESVNRLTVHRDGKYYFYAAVEYDGSNYNLVRYPGSVYDTNLYSYEDMEKLTKDDIEYARLFFIFNYYFSEYRATEIREAHEYVQVPSENHRHNNKRYERKLCTIRYIGAPKAKRDIVITAPCWTVVGHYRHLKNGNKIFIKSYRKGKYRNNPELLKGKDYVMSE